MSDDLFDGLTSAELTSPNRHVDSVVDDSLMKLSLAQLSEHKEVLITQLRKLEKLYSSDPCDDWAKAITAQESQIEACTRLLESKEE